MMIGTMESESTSKNSNAFYYDYQSSHDPLGTFNPFGTANTTMISSRKDDNGDNFDKSLNHMRLDNMTTLFNHSLHQTMGARDPTFVESTTMARKRSKLRSRNRNERFIPESLEHNEEEDPMINTSWDRKIINKEDSVLGYHCCRQIFSCLLFVVILIIFYFPYRLLFNYQFPHLNIEMKAEGSTFNINANNTCIIIRKATSDRKTIKVRYTKNLGWETYLYPFFSADHSFKTSDGNTNFTASVSNPLELDIYKSKLYLNIPEDHNIELLKIVCSRCLVMSDSPITAKDMIIEGFDIHLNMLEVTLSGSLNTDVQGGILQFNLLEVSGYSKILSQEVDIYLQTRSSTRVNVVEGTVDYCYSAANVNTITPLTCSPINSLNFVSLVNKVEQDQSCTGAFNLCPSSSPTCTPQQILEVSYYYGHAYINVLEKDTILPQDSAQIERGRALTEGLIDMNPIDRNRLIHNFKKVEKESLMPLMMVFDFQNVEALSTSGVRWMATSYNGNDNTIGTYMAYSSFNSLIRNNLKTQVKLKPAFCPFRTSISKGQLYEQMHLLKTLLDETGSEKYNISFVRSRDMNYKSDGFMEYSGVSSNFSRDFRMGSFINTKGELESQLPKQVLELSYRNERDLSYSNVTGRLLSGIGALLCTILIFSWIVKTAKNIRKTILQKKNYLAFNFNGNEFIDYSFMVQNSTAPSKDGLEDVNPQVTDDNDTEYILSMTFVMKYLLTSYFMKRINSVQLFFSYLFKPVSEEQIQDQEIRMGSKMSIIAKEMEYMYQQFCFWNMLSERSLFSFENIKQLNQMGYRAISLGEGTIYLNKVLLKKVSDVDLSESDLAEYKSSLHAFIEFYLMCTNYDNDQLPVAVFEHQYIRFCDTFHIERKKVDVSFLKSEFDIDALIKYDKVIERDVNSHHSSKRRGLLCYKEKPLMFMIDSKRIQDYIRLVSRFVGESHIPGGEIRKLAKAMIFNKQWFIVELYTAVLLVMVIYTSILLFYLQNYYDLKDRLNVGSREIINDQPPLSLLELLINPSSEMSFDHYSTSVGREVTVYLWVLTLVVSYLTDQNIYMIHHKNLSQKNYFLRMVYFIQWGVLFISFAWNIYGVIMFTHGYLLASTIKPKALVPYAVLYTGSLILVIFHVYDFMNSRKHLKDMLKGAFKEMSISNYIEKVQGASNAHEKQEKLRKANDSSSKSNILLSEMPIPDSEIEQKVRELFAKLAADQQLDRRWGDFIVGVLLKQKDQIKSCLKDIVETDPVNLPPGSLQLVHEVLSSEVKDNYLFESLVVHLLKIIMRNEKFYLRRLKLTEIQFVEVCECDPQTQINEQFFCSACQDPKVYTPAVRAEIQRIMIEKNTSIFLSLLELMDCVRKKQTSKILPIFIDKILPEGLRGRELEMVAVILRTVMISFFKLDEKFDRMEFNQCINSIFMKFFKVESNILTMMNMIEDITDDNAVDLKMNPIEDTVSKVNFVKRSIIDPLINANATTQNIARFVSLSTILLGNDSMIPNDLVANYTAHLNRDKRIKWREQGIRLFMETLMYFKITPRAILSKVKANALKYEIDEDLSSSVLYIKSVTSALNHTLEIENYQSIENTTFFIKIRQRLRIKSNLLLGLIYFINDALDENEVFKLFDYISQKNKVATDPFVHVLAIAVSRRYHRLHKAFLYFDFHYLKMYAYLRARTAEHRTDEQLFEEEKMKDYTVTVVNDLPFRLSDRTKAVSLLEDAFRFCSYPLYRRFMKLLNKDGNLEEMDPRSQQMANLKTFQMLWELAAGESVDKPAEIFKQFRYQFKDFENHKFYFFCQRILVLIGEMRSFKKSTSKTLNRATVDSFSELLRIKVQDIDAFLGIFYSDPEKLIEAIQYFYSDKAGSAPNWSRLGLINHIVYIKKSIDYIAAQIHFFQRLQGSYDEEPAPEGPGRPGVPALPAPNIKSLPPQRENQKLAIIIMRKILMPNVKLRNFEIMQLLDAIIVKIFHTADGMQNSSKIKNFYEQLFFDVLGSNGTYTNLGRYFHDCHGEKFLQTLTTCMSSESQIQRTNILFADLMKRPLKNVTMFLYLYLFVKGIIQRDQFDEKESIEQKFAQAYGVHKEFFDLLEFTLNQNLDKFDLLLINIHTKIAKRQEPRSLTQYREDVDWAKLYVNILSLFQGETPDLPFFSDLLKVPLSKLNFIYILNNLKNPNKCARTLEELGGSISFQEIVESLNVRHEEITHLLRVCLNNVSFQSLNEFVKIMKLEKEIDVNVLINLLMIDLKLEHSHEGCLEQYRKMGLYSEIFKQMGVSKEISWAVIRVLKGDFLNFKKMLKSADSQKDQRPNIRKFLKLVSSLAGSKNTEFRSFTVKTATPFPKAMEMYQNLLSDKKLKQNSKEYAHCVLHEVLGINPFWAVLERASQFRNNCKGSTGDSNEGIIDIRTVPGLNMFVFHVLTIINRTKLEDLEPFLNFAFLWTVQRYLKSLTLKEPSAQAREKLEDLKKRFSDLYQSSLESMKGPHHKNFFKFEYHKSYSDYSMLKDLDFESTNIVKTFSQFMNQHLVLNWSKKLRQEQEELPPDVESFVREVTRKSDSQKSVYDYFEKEDSKLKGASRLDSFLDSAFEKMLEDMDDLNLTFHSYGDPPSFEDLYSEEGPREDQAPAGAKEKDPLGETTKEKDPFGETASLSSSEDSVLDKGEGPPLEPKQDKVKFLVSGVLEFAVYSLLMRLKNLRNKKYEDKIIHEVQDRYFRKTDFLFNLIEKLAIFQSGFEGFRKHHYMLIFNLSQGYVLQNKRIFRQKYSLFSPELVLLSQRWAKVYSKSTFHSEYETDFPHSTVLGRLHMLLGLIEHDKLYKQAFAPFSSRTFHSKVENLSMVNHDGHGPTLNIGDYYFAPFLMRIRLVKPSDFLQMDENLRLKNISTIIRERKHYVDPSHLAFEMLEAGLYNVDFESKNINSLKTYYCVNHKKGLEVPRIIKSIESIKKHCYFLNDLALGFIPVLSGTKNLFTDNVFLSKHQRIYTSFLKLHNLNQVQREGRLQESKERQLNSCLVQLSRHLNSNNQILKHILIFVLFDQEDLSLLQRFLFQNSETKTNFQYTWHFMKLASGAKDSRKSGRHSSSGQHGWLESFFKQKGLSQRHAQLNTSLLRIYLRVKERRGFGSAVKKKNDDLLEVLRFMLNMSNNSLRHTKFLITLKDIVKQRSESVYTVSEFDDNQDAKAIYQSLVEMDTTEGGSKVIDAKEACQFLNFSQQVIFQKYEYFEEADAELEYLLLNHFEVNNLNLLNLFKLLKWLKDKEDDTKQEVIERHFYEFLNYGNFNLMNLNIEKIKLLIIFLKNFNKAEVTGILQFLRDLQLNPEYVYILTHYVWMAVINGRIKTDQPLDKKLQYSLSHLSFFPFIHLLKNEMVEHHNEMGFSMDTYSATINRLYSKMHEEIGKVPYEKVLNVIETDIDSVSFWDENYLGFIRGDAFTSLDKAFKNTYDNLFMSLADIDKDLEIAINAAYELFYFEKIPTSANKSKEEMENIRTHIELFLDLISYHQKNRKLMADTFARNEQFHIGKIGYQSIRPHESTLQFMCFKSSARQKNITQKLIKGGYLLWVIKQYVIQMRKHDLLKLNDAKTKYKQVFNALFYQFYQRILKPDICKSFESITLSAIVLFLSFKFKKTINSVFRKLVNFLEKYVYKRPSIAFHQREIQKIDIEVFFELKDILMHDRRYSNRNPENIMRLCLNICRKLDFLRDNQELEDTYIYLVKLASGDLEELEFFLKKLLKRNDKVAYVMSAVRWSEALIKSNHLKKHLKNKRSLNAHKNINKNASYLHELAPTDQQIFLNNIRKRGVAYVEIFSFFQAGLPDRVNFNKYDVYKILRRMGYTMTVHRFIEITAESLVSRRNFLTHQTNHSEETEFTHAEVLHSLGIVEEKVLESIFVQLEITPIDAVFRGTKVISMYGIMGSMLVIAFDRIWDAGEFGWLINCIPIVVLFSLLMSYSRYNNLLMDNYGPKIKETIQMLFGEDI